MSKKYIDLAEQIAESLEFYTAGDARQVLAWLDDHPSQVPGRTITESEYEDALEGKSWDYGIGYFEAISNLGITVIPDPEPTNEENLISDLAEINTEQSLGLLESTIREIAGNLDHIGWAKESGENDELRLRS